MNWEALGAVGEILGAVALLFVVIQVRHAREEMRRSIRGERTDTLIQNLHWMRDPARTQLRMRANEAMGGEAPGSFIRDVVERAGVTQAEAMSLWIEFMIHWQYYANKVIAYKDDLTPGDRFQADTMIGNIFGQPLGRAWFEANKWFLNADGVRYVETLLETPPRRAV